MSISRAVLLSLFATSCAFAADETSNHLVPLNPYSTPEYRRLYEKKLFTAGEIARFVYLPGAVDPEMVVSVHRRSANIRNGSASYWVTVTKPSSRLWLCIHTGDEKFTGRKDLDPRTVRTLKADAQLPESTALAIHALWMAALEETAAHPCVDCLLVDAYTMLFSAVDARGKLCQAQLPISPSKHMRSLVDIGFELADYVNDTAADRPKISQKIERTALVLQRRSTER
jgi:hypothetical protein